jgi:glycogen phosphorylase
MTTQHETDKSDGRKVVIQVEDDRTGMSPAALQRAVWDHLQFTRSKDITSATPHDVFHALAHTVRDRLVRRWMATQRTYADRDPKRVYYLSAEFLLGRALANNLLSLGLYDLAKAGLKSYGLEIADVLEEEPDPGLGNGGLGRLAACFLDSMATLALPGYGYGIRYEFGIFRQEIVDGWQLEQPDEWLEFGCPWDIARPEYTVVVNFGGRVVHARDEDGRVQARWIDTQSVRGVPHDMPIAGYGNNTVNTLRLWQARASREFDLQVFNDGDYRRAVEEKAISESISKVLYPKDDSPEGKVLRLKQQYFFVACSIHDIMRRYKKSHGTFEAFADKAAIQLNDTHPAIAVAELMRVLVDRERLPWERAWDITQRTLAYTNHTLLPEALERWPLALFEKVLPRHLEIIYEINHRFLREVHVFSPEDNARRARMSIIEEGPPKQVRMAHLAVVGSHSINGVAALHSQLVKDVLLKDFAELWPKRFNNKTNGVTPRRWLRLCNPRLSAAISSRIGDAWVTDLDKLVELRRFVGDAAFHTELAAIKRANKEEAAQLIKERSGVELPADSLWDVQVKRIHEYKRQLMNCLHVVHLYRKLKVEGVRDVVPRVVIFGGKAAPGYARAKKHIKLINDVAQVVNADRSLEGKLRCVFVPNYNVSLAERVIPAADLSEQISTAGKEASGTGNMKFQMNGALTMGTLDGANVEIREEVGGDNFFLFGHTADEVEAMVAAKYHPRPYLERSSVLRGALELIEKGVFSPDDRHLYADVVSYLRDSDPYLICADFDGYVDAQERAARAYATPSVWGAMVVANIAGSGKFSSDRTIRDYAREIWEVEPVPIELEPYTPPA